MATAADILRSFPEFEAATDEEIEPFLALAAERISPAFFGRTFAQALALLAGHLKTLAKRGASGGGSGPIISERAGTVARSYAIAGGGGGDGSSYASTSYGLMYLELRRSRVGGMPFSTAGLPS